MSYLIAETTKEEREKIVADALGNIEASCDGCMPGLAEMYQDYIDGEVQIVGRPLYSFFSYEFTGLSSKDGRPTFANIGEENWEVYDAMTNEDVFQTVMNFSGCRMPYIQGGIGNTFTYGNFMLSCNFTYSVGAKVRLLKLYSNVKNLIPYPA